MARSVDPSTIDTGAGALASTEPVVPSELPTNKVARPGDKMSGGLWVSPDTPEVALRVTGTAGVAVQVAGVTNGISIQAPAPTNGVAIQSGAGNGAVVLQAVATGTGKVLEATSADDSAVLATSSGAPTIKATSNGAFPGVWGLGQPGLSGQGIGAGTGVEGVGGNINGIGVQGTGDGVGTGVAAQGGAAGGYGVQAVGGAAGGYGVHAQSSAASAALYAEAQGTGAGLQAISVDGPGILVAGGNNRTAADLTGGADAPAIQAWAGGYGPTVVAWSGTSGLTNHSSTFQAGSSASALKLNASASTVDGFYVGWKITIGAGADSVIENDWRYVISYNGATQVAVVEPPFTGVPSNGDSYILRTPSTAAVIAQGQRSGVGAHVLAGYETHRSTVANNVPPSDTSFELASGSATNSYYVGWAVSIDGQVTRCTGYVGASKVLTVSPALTLAPGVGVDILLLKGQAGLSITGARVHDGVNATDILNGTGLQVTADLPVYLSNPGGKRGHLYLEPSTAALPSNSTAGDLWVANDSNKDLYYRDSAGWLNMSALARRVEHFGGHLGFIKEFVGTWVDARYSIPSTSLVVANVGYDVISKRAYQQYTCTALDGGLSSFSLGWEIPIPHGFQEWTDIELRFGSSVTGIPYTVTLLDTSGASATLVGDTGVIPAMSIQTVNVSVTDGVYEGGKVAILAIKIQPDNATAQLRFYGAKVTYRA
jgi:hypothetical protein